MIGPLVRIEPDVTASRVHSEALLSVLPARQTVPPLHGDTSGSRLNTTPKASERDSGDNSGDGAAAGTGLAPSGDVSRLLSLLADRTRLKILRILAGGERPVVALTSELRLPQPTVSHHLAWLRMMDLVSPRRQGKHVFYALGPSAKFDDTGTMTFRAFDAVVTVAPKRPG